MLHIFTHCFFSCWNVSSVIFDFTNALRFSISGSYKFTHLIAEESAASLILPIADNNSDCRLYASHVAHTHAPHIQPQLAHPPDLTQPLQPPHIAQPPAQLTGARFAPSRCIYLGLLVVPKFSIFGASFDCWILAVLMIACIHSGNAPTNSSLILPSGFLAICA